MDQPGFLGDLDETDRRDRSLDRMIPPDQCLEARDLIGRDIEQGLVQEFELLFADCGVEILLDLQAMYELAFHIRLEEAPDPAAFCLGLIQCHVAALQQCVGVHLSLSGQRNTDTGTDHDRVSGKAIRRAERRDHPIRELARGPWQIVRDIGDRELIPAEPGDDVSAPQTIAQTASSGFQQQIPDRVAQRVVDVFEPVQVEIEKGEVGIAIGAIGDDFL